jgi:GTPase SAR1 family protein
MFLLQNWERICTRGYVPTVEDILHSRLRTTGIVQDNISFLGCNFSWILTGGQRSERRKWVHTFDDVGVVIFVVSLSEYNTTLAEHETVNRMQESFQVFAELTRSKWFANVPIVLVFNKYDLFVEKIQRFDLNVCFPEYTGGCDHNSAFRFIINKFKSAAERKIEIQVTVAIDTESTMITLTEIMRSYIAARNANNDDIVRNFQILPQAIVNHVLADRT